MADEPEVYRFDSFTDVDLYNLAEIARKEDYSRLAQWIMGHKDRELAARSHRHLERRKREYSELLGQLMQTYHKYGSPSPLGFKRIIKDISDINSLADRMIDLLEDNEIDKGDAKSLISRDSFRKLVKLLASAEPKNTHPEVIIDYEHRLREDHVFLLEELIHILTTEYDKRVLETRRRFEDYLGPHQRVLNNVRREIADIDLNLGQLEHDDLLLPEERRKIQEAFRAKRAELKEIERVEAFKLKKIEFLCLSIRDGVEQFRGLIDSLQAQLDSYKSRQSYVEKLARLGARIPEFRALLESLYASFQDDLGDLQKSFLVFDRSFQELVLKTVDNESVVSRIVLTPPRFLDAELEIVNPSASAHSDDESDEEESDPDRIDVDISFLREYHYRN
jgi:hypothetical protein